MTIRMLKVSTVSIVLAATLSSADPGFTVFHVGNSLTDETYGMHDIAQGFGYTWTDIVHARSMIPGSPIWLLWSENVKRTADKSEGGCGFFLECSEVGGFLSWIDQKYPSLWSTTLYLNAMPMDVLVLQIFNSNGDSWENQWSPGLNSGTIDGVLGYAREAYRGNPHCQIYLYASHTMEEGAIDNSMASTIINYKAIKDTISQTFPDNKPVFIIPAPLAFNAMLNAGFTELWVPGDGHANDNGKYLLSALFYAIIYKRDPAGATTDGFGNLGSGYAAKARQVAWDVATTYEYSGIGSTPVSDNRRATPSIAVQRTPAHAGQAHNLAGRTVPAAAARAAMRLVTPTQAGAR